MKNSDTDLLCNSNLRDRWPWFRWALCASEKWNGAGLFFAGPAATAELYQDINVSAYIQSPNNKYSFYFRGYVASYQDNDKSRIILEYRNSDGTVLSSFDTGNLGSLETWIKVENDTVP